MTFILNDMIYQRGNIIQQLIWAPLTTVISARSGRQEKKQIHDTNLQDDKFTRHWNLNIVIKF